MKDELFALVQSLSPSEKRYFKIFASRHVLKGNNNYETLFDFLAANAEDGEYDENKIKNFLDKKKIKNLPQLKHYLYDLILRSMRSFNESSSLIKSIQQRIDDVKFLIEKGLYIKGRQFIQIAKRQAIGIECYNELLELLSLERTIIRLSIDKDAPQLFEQINKQVQYAIEQLNSEQQYKILYDRTFLLIQKEYTPRNPGIADKTVSIINHTLLLPRAKPASFNAQVLYYLIHSDIAQLKNDYKTSMQQMQEVIKLFQSDKVMKTEQSTRFINILNNYLNACYLSDDWKSFSKALQLMKQIEPATEYEQLQLFKNRPYLEMLYHVNLKNWEQAGQLVAEIDEGLKKFKNKLPSSRVLVMEYNIAMMYFLMRNFDKCLDWLNKIIYGDIQDIRQDIITAARIFQIAVQYELENYTLTASLIRNTRRYFTNNNRLLEFEKAALGLLSKIIDKPGKKEQSELLKNTRNQLEILQKKQSSNIAGIVEFNIWIESRLTGIKMTELLANKT